MKYLFSAFLLSTLFFQSCEELPNDSATEQSEDSAKSQVKKIDSIPRPVIYGAKGKTYAYMPDSCLNDLIIGDSKSFKSFRKENGSESSMFFKDRYRMAWYNNAETEELEVLVTGTEKGGFYPYCFILQKAHQKGAPDFDIKHQFVSNRNFITCYGIYIGMSPEYVQNVYQCQTMMEWQKGDTLYLQYKPQAKDEKYYTHYNYQTYSATYKFVDGLLRRMEYYVDPKNFELIPMKD